MSRVLVIGDTHAPFTHRFYREFCERIRGQYKCDKVVHVGDEVDNHAISYHESDPDGFSAGREGELAQASLERWYSSFPEVSVCIGNHGNLHFRKAKTAGLPGRFIRGHAEAWAAPSGWSWAEDHEIDGVRYLHGVGYSGANAHRKIALESRQSSVIGHIHCHGGVSYLASEYDLIFGMNAGCGIDVDAYAMAYAKPFRVRPTLGCGVVIDGCEAYFVPMRFKNKRLRRPRITVPTLN